MKVLTINTYAGSLLVGAELAGCEIIGSLEDESAYGVDIQHLNYKDIRIHSSHHSKWGTFFPDLHDVVVIAHPPCAGFSVQNNSQSSKKKGINSDAFECTKNILEFAMSRGAMMIAIESVIPALEGGRKVHDEYAAKYGYSVHRILQNAVTFGVPQNRERFWVIFWLNDGDAPEAEFFVRVQPDIKKIGNFIDSNGYTPEHINDEFMSQRRRWFAEGIAEDTIMALCSGKFGPGQLNGKITGSKDYDKYALYKFRSRNIRLLDINGWTNTLLSDSFWIVPTDNMSDGRVATIEEFCSFMGFPRDYEFGVKLMKGQFRQFLSKGVCPPVATWILENIRNNLNGLFEFNATHSVKDGDTLNLCGYTAPTSPSEITRATKVA